MSQFRKPFYTSINPSIKTRNMNEITEKTGNVYESLCIVSKRADQISSKVKEEIQNKLNDFSTLTDNLEEILENREQAEISRFYEKLPESTLMSLEEFMDNKIYFHRKPVNTTEQ